MTHSHNDIKTPKGVRGIYIYYTNNVKVNKVTSSLESNFQEASFNWAREFLQLASVTCSLSL